MLKSRHKENEGETTRLRLLFQGNVQGVGLRPFVYRLAQELGLFGWVKNSPEGVVIEVEGHCKTIERFTARLVDEKPRLASLIENGRKRLQPVGDSSFVIHNSENKGSRSLSILPDIATCDQCLAEMKDPKGRRFRYPFTNCTLCGPRFSIIEKLPYDRAHTTMGEFSQCEQCKAEYQSPLNRRFHAESNCCPKCGPEMQWWDASGKCLARQEEAFQKAVASIRAGAIVAVKGIGGFHLLVDARNNNSVKRLRLRKQRPDKPFALLYPSLDRLRKDCEVSPVEASLLDSSAAPIVILVRKEDGCDIAPSVSPDNPNLGVMLPSNPIHHILMWDLEFPVIATSGNISEEPICIDEKEALGRLGRIADGFLIHNRKIVRHIDDSIVRVIAERPLMLRRSRGYAPLAMRWKGDGPAMVAMGGHLKNTVAIARGRDVCLSHHIGDLDNPKALACAEHTLSSLCSLYESDTAHVVSDLHPDYSSSQRASQWGQQSRKSLVKVQHHYAHVLSCLADNGIPPPVLGIAWDGSGYGTDGTIWGGEFLKLDSRSFQRVAHLRPFRLPGGEKAVREPRRVALSLLHEIGMSDVFHSFAKTTGFSAGESKLIEQMLTQDIRCPVTSSMGRLFDGVSALLGICLVSSFEGQAACSLEFLAQKEQTREYYDIVLSSFENGSTFFDWAPMISSIMEEKAAGISTRHIARKFHNTLSELVIAIAHLVGEPKVILTGGCFQNKLLSETTIERLKREGFEPHWHKQIPPNDGGIALGQLVAASMTITGEFPCV